MVGMLLLDDDGGFVVVNDIDESLLGFLDFRLDCVTPGDEAEGGESDGDDGSPLA